MRRLARFSAIEPARYASRGGSGLQFHHQGAERLRAVVVAIERELRVAGEGNRTRDQLRAACARAGSAGEVDIAVRHIDRAAEILRRAAVELEARSGRHVAVTEDHDAG